MSGVQLPEEYLVDLRASGLTDTTIQALRLRPASMNDMPFPASGYVIPYYVPSDSASAGPKGSYMPIQAQGRQYTRVKITSHPGSSGASGSVQSSNGNGLPKYYQAPNTGTHVYFPPLLDPLR